jgi:hypothetical protein
MSKKNQNFVLDQRILVNNEIACHVVMVSVIEIELNLLSGGGKKLYLVTQYLLHVCYMLVSYLSLFLMACYK